MKITPILLTLFITLLGCGEETQDNAIHGTWKLVSFVNEKTDETLFQNDFHNSSQITVDFKSDMRFSGSTTRNTFHVHKFALLASESRANFVVPDAHWRLGLLSYISPLISYGDHF